jgi:hypothetical protein
MRAGREAHDRIVDGLKFYGWRADGVGGRCIAAKSPP